MVHPLQTESVNYITQRTGLMMTFCYLLTLYGAIRALEAEHPGRWLVACVVSCASGMACKEAMVSAPVVVLLYYWAFGGESILRTLSRHRVLWAALATTWLPLAALIASGPRADTVGFGLGVSAFDYAMNQCVVILDYLRLAFWPHPLSIYYGPPRPLAPSEVLPEALALLTLLVATAIALWRRPRIGFPAACFFLILAPTSSFVPIVTEVGAERRMYLPLAGLCVLVVIGGFSLLDWAARRAWAEDERRASRVARWSGIAVVAIVVALLSTATVRRNRDYRSVMTLWQSAVEAMPDNPQSHVNLGNEFLIRGELQQAERHYRAALGLDPDDTLAHYNLGQVFHAREQLEPAIRSYARAAELAPDFARAHYSLSRALLEAGRLDEAIASLREVIRLRPDFAPAREELALLLARRPGATAPRD
jgi:cytochrome c-type biogenesis protein CcmH/NrfG